MSTLSGPGRLLALFVVASLLAGGGGLVAFQAFGNPTGAAEFTSVADVLAGRVPAGSDVTLEETRVVAVLNSSTCTRCATWEKVTTLTLESLTSGARVDAVLKKVGGNLLQYKKQNGVPTEGMLIRLGGTVTQGGGTWKVDPAKEWVEFSHVGPTVTLADVDAGRVPVGSYVWLEPASPWRIFHSTDGDYHIEMEAPGGARLTTEVTPPHLDELPVPSLGERLELFGMVLWDADHDHWEIHPIRCLQRDLCAGGLPQGGVPGAPAAVHASPGDGEVRVSWAAPYSGGGDLTGYRVFRARADETDLRPIGDVAEPFLVDRAVENRVEYRYAVAALSGRGEGPKSAEVVAFPLPGGGTRWLVEGFESEVDDWAREAAEGGSAWLLVENRGRDGETAITCGDGETYEPDTRCTLATPRLDLTRATSALLRWWERLDTGAPTGAAVPLGLLDKGSVEASRDGGRTWAPLAQSAQPTQGRWVPRVADLSPYLGEGDVRVRFTFTSDATLEGEGWFLDDLQVIGERRAPSEPTALAATDGADGVRLAWTAPADAAPGTTYRVYRGAAADALQFHAEAGAATTWVDASPLETQFYAVAAVDGLQGAVSDALEATHDPGNGGGGDPVDPGDPGDALFTDTFETGATGWTTERPGGSGTSRWKLVTTQAHSPTHSWTCGGGSSYSPNANCLLISPVVDVSGAAAPQVRFWHKIGGESGRDEGTVQLRVDGGAWQEVRGPYSGVHSWTEEVIPVPAGADTVQVRFRFTSDATGSADAWFVDDFRVTSG